jgi:carbamate kinase
LNERSLWKPIVTILTQVLVDKDDPSIENPTKFVGPFYKQGQVKELETKRGWTIKEDTGRGYRRVVPSPMPRQIMSKDIIKNLLNQDAIVIAAGGGGIPVYKEESGWLEGVDGVIDKDLAAAVLAHDIDAQELFILTGVDKVAINFKKSGQRNLDHLTIDEAKNFLQEGHFPPGSMGPKIEAAILFLEQGGEQVIITSIENAAEVVIRGGGTVVTHN